MLDFIPTGPLSISFYFDYEIIEFGRALKQELVRHTWRNTDNIARGKLSPDTALNRTVAFFVRPHCFSVDQSATDQQGRRTGLHKEDINLSLMPLGLTVGLPMDQHRAVVGKVREEFDGKMVRIGGGIGMHFALEILQ
jgi:hypothetical protein